MLLLFFNYWCRFHSIIIQNTSGHVLITNINGWKPFPAMFTLIWFLNIFEHSNSSSSNLTISSAATSWTYARGPTNIHTYDWRDPRSSQPDSSEQAWTRSRRNQSFCTGHRRLEFCRRRNLQTFPHPVLRSFRFSEKNLLGGSNFVNIKIQK